MPQIPDRPVRAAIGVHRRLLQRGQRDGDGWLVRHNNDPVWDVLLIKGPIDVTKLSHAVEAVCSQADSLHVRLQHSDDGPVAVWQDERPIRLEIFDVNDVTSKIGLDPVVAALVAEIIFTKCDLRTAPSGRVALMASSPTDHLLVLSFDHTVADGWSLERIVRRVFATYRSTDGGGEISAGRRIRGSSFSSYVDDIAKHLDSKDVSDRWTEWLGPYTPPGPLLTHLGGEDRPNGDYVLTDFVQAEMPEDLGPKLAAISHKLGCSRSETLIAVGAAAARLWSDSQQPVHFLRHGRYEREHLDVIGILMENCISVPPADDLNVMPWLAAQVASNRASPYLYGESLRELGLLSPRRVVVNVRPPSRPHYLDAGTTADTVPGSWLEALWPDGRPTQPSDAAVVVHFYLDRPGRLSVLLEVDAAVTGDVSPLIDTLTTLLRVAADAGETRLLTLQDSNCCLPAKAYESRS